MSIFKTAIDAFRLDANEELPQIIEDSEVLGGNIKIVSDVSIDWCNVEKILEILINEPSASMTRSLRPGRADLVGEVFVAIEWYCYHLTVVGAAGDWNRK